jgi:hypothetical protein
MLGQIRRKEFQNVQDFRAATATLICSNAHRKDRWGWRSRMKAVAALNVTMARNGGTECRRLSPQTPGACHATSTSPPLHRDLKPEANIRTGDGFDFSMMEKNCR